jgi:serine/threonine-protein kinase
VQRELGSGSLGTVYLALDREKKRLVALKVLRMDRLTEAAISGMQLEFRAISSLRHPRIAEAYDFGYTEQGRVPFYTREYIPGVPLAAGPPADHLPGRYLEPILDLLEALSYLHAHGVLHLDVHAGNLILAAERKRGGVLIDFGLACSPGSRAQAMYRTGIADAPPEILRGLGPTPKTDVFLAGRLLQYRLTGRVGGAIRLLTEIPGWTSKRILDLERIATKATQPEPEHRFPSAEEFREKLEEVLLRELLPRPRGDPSGGSQGGDHRFRGGAAAGPSAPGPASGAVRRGVPRRGPYPRGQLQEGAEASRRRRPASLA